MVSEENRRYKFAPRKKHSEERKVKLKSILEKARAVKGSKIAPLTYKQRLVKLETNNNNSSNNDVNNEIIPMLDFLNMRIDDLEDENSSLITKIEELKLNNNNSSNNNNNSSNNNNNNNSDNEEIIPMVDFLSVRIDDLEEDIESIKDVNNNVPRTNQDNNKLKDAINNLNNKINTLETNQEETKKDISEIFSDLNDLEDKLDN